MEKGGYVRCAECSQIRAPEDIVWVDEAPICRGCMYGDAPAVCLHPIGFVRNAQRRDSTDFGLRNAGDLSRLELFASQKRFMYRLEEEERLTVVYHLHKARPVRSRFRRGLDGKEVGVFASRTPDRLTPIGIQDVRLIGIEGTTVIVEGLDAIDGTPVLDIKMCWRKE